MFDGDSDPSNLDMEEILKENPAGVISYLSSAFDGLSKEERRQKLTNCLNTVVFGVENTKRSLISTKEDIESARVKYENMNDLVKTMEQLKCSLEEHIKTVRLNEGSFAGTAAVLEYDIAKSRTNTLINVIKARSQLDNAKEALAEGGDDQQRMFESLIDMQQSYDTLRQFVPKHGDDKTLEELKDRYLGWQSAALVFAIKQADYEKLAEIQRAYEKLGRKDEFLGTFKRVSINRLKEYSPSATNLSSLISGLQKEVDFVYTHHYQITAKFLAPNKAMELLVNALTDGLSQLNLEDTIAELLAGIEDPIIALQRINEDLQTNTPGTSEAESLLNSHINDVIKNCAATPLRSALTSYVLSRINSIELASGSFRAKLAQFKEATADFLQLLHDVFTHSQVVYGSDTKVVASPAIEKGIENFVAKIKSWNYSVKSTGENRPITDIIDLCRAAGSLIYGINQFKTLVENFDPTMTPNMKGVNRWNKGIVEAILSSLKESCSASVKNIVEYMESTKKAGGNHPAPRIGLMFSPSEQITTLGQETYHLCRMLEDCFDDDDICLSFMHAFKKKFERETLFKQLAADMADKVMTDFIAGIPQELTPHAIHQIVKDTEFLKDAFDDLRIGDTSALDDVVNSLKQKL